MYINYSAVSNCGKVRSANQDIFAINEHFFYSERQQSQSADKLELNTVLYFSVFDGMGGESYGAKAAQLASKTICGIYKMSKNIDPLQICMAMNRSVCEYMQINGIKSMGTTSAFAIFTPNEVQLCNIGDSRIYRVSKKGFEQLSEDHSEQFGLLPSRRLLTQHLGIPPEELVIEPFCCKIPLCKNDRYLLCTDGLTDMVTDEEIYQIICQNKTEQIGEVLVDAALKNGGRDNITAIICEVE